MKKTPIELIQKAEDDIKNGVLPRNQSIKHYLIEFREQLKSTGISDNAIRTYFASVKSFYNYFDIPFPNKIFKNKKAQPYLENLEIPSIDNVRIFLKYCDVRDKAIVLVGLSSGLSANEIINLKVSDFKSGYDEETKITTLTLRRGKTGVNFATFITPEASEAVWDYLNYRNAEIKFKDVSRKNAALKQQFTDDNNYLFIKNFISKEFLEKRNDELRKINENKGLSEIYNSINTHLGKESTNKRRHLVRSHNIRKLFNTILKTNGCNNTMVEYWMGHSLGKTEDAYFKPTVEAMKNTYTKYIPYLTVQKELDISKSLEYQRIIEEKGRVEGELVKSVLERSELEEIKEELDKRKKADELLDMLMEKLGIDNSEILTNLMKNS
ncbi:tyrosine-type recombinase/integrase [Methanococcoides sp. SA1]|nr:tyrosine-type recombinase/integrase [Methanococcoides sp. SA1]